jgi:hypothetical protein
VAEEIRTPDFRNNNPQQSNSKSLADNNVTLTLRLGCTNGCTTEAKLVQIANSLRELLSTSDCAQLGLMLTTKDVGG